MLVDLPARQSQSRKLPRLCRLVANIVTTLCVRKVPVRKRRGTLTGLEVKTACVAAYSLSQLLTG